MKKYVVVAIISAIVGMVAGYALSKKAITLTDIERAEYNTLPYKIELLESYRDYFNSCETLLDSIYNATGWSEDLFNDIVMESDTYYNYEVARERTTFLYRMEDSDITWEEYLSFLGTHNLKPYNKDLQ